MTDNTDRLAAALAPTHRHVKRGTEYLLIGFGKMQAEDWTKPGKDANASGGHFAPVDMSEVAIYRSATDPTEIWVRPREEFEDGRFVVLPAPASPVPESEGEAKP